LPTKPAGSFEIAWRKIVGDIFAKLVLYLGNQNWIVIVQTDLIGKVLTLQIILILFRQIFACGQRNFSPDPLSIVIKIRISYFANFSNHAPIFPQDRIAIKDCLVNIWAIVEICVTGEAGINIRN
jgi:hypothetical protein